MPEKLKLIWVIGNEEGKVDKGRVILWERHPDHPNGEVVIVNDGRSYEVAETKSVKELIGQEVLLRSSAHVNWTDKTEGGTAEVSAAPVKNKGGRPRSVPPLRPSTDAEEDATTPPLVGDVEKDTGRVPAV